MQPMADDAHEIGAETLHVQPDQTVLQVTIAEGGGMQYTLGADGGTCNPSRQA